MSSTSESSAFEYRRRLPEVPRAVRFSGDVLNRIDDVAEKIDSVGSRMRQVENIIHDYKADPPIRDGHKIELLRLRDEVNKTINHIDQNIEGPQRVLVSDYQARVDTADIRSQLSQLNSKIQDSKVEKEIQKREIERLNGEREQIARTKDGDITSLERKLREQSERENYLTQHLNAVTERADTVSCRNHDLQKEVVDSQSETGRLRKDCQSLVQSLPPFECLISDISATESVSDSSTCSSSEIFYYKEIEKLRLEQVENKKMQQDNERITAQLGRQVAEHRSVNEKHVLENSDLRSSLADAGRNIETSTDRIRNIEALRDQLTSENRILREDNCAMSDQIKHAVSKSETLKSETESAHLRETALRSELNSVRERNGALEQAKSDLSNSSEDLHQNILRLETENRCMKSRITELEAESTRQSERIQQADEKNSTTATKLYQSESRISELLNCLERLETKAKNNVQVQQTLDVELGRLRGENGTLQATIVKTSDQLAAEVNKSAVLQRELEQFQQKYKSDLKINQQQIANLLTEVEEGKKKNTSEISRMTQSCAKDLKVMQDQATAAKAELAASNDEVRHQTAKTRSLQTQLRDLESQLAQITNELEVCTRRMSDVETLNGNLKENSTVIETELLNSRQEIAKLDILLKRSCAIAYPSKAFETIETMEELPNYIEQLQQSNDAHKSKTQQISLHLEQTKMKHEKHSRELQGSKRSLMEELSLAKDEALALSQKNATLGVDNSELKLQIQGLKDKFELLAQELEHHQIKKEIKLLNQK